MAPRGAGRQPRLLEAHAHKPESPGGSRGCWRPTRTSLSRVDPLDLQAGCARTPRGACPSPGVHAGLRPGLGLATRMALTALSPTAGPHLDNAGHGRMARQWPVGRLPERDCRPAVAWQQQAEWHGSSRQSMVRPTRTGAAADTLEPAATHALHQCTSV